MSLIQIPNLPAVIGLNGEELFEGVQAGTSVKISLNQMIAATRAGLPTTLPIPVSLGGTGATTLTGYVQGNGTSPFTASPTIPNTDITGLGTMSTQNANAVAITGGTAALTGVSSVTVNSASTAFTVTQTGAGNAFLVEDSASDTTPFVIDASGNVGIGTTSPAYKVDVNGIINTNSSLYLTQPSTGSANIVLGNGRAGDGLSYVDFIGDATYTTFGLRIIRNGTANGDTYINNRGTGSLTLRATDAGTLTFQTTATERMRIDASGRLLIGTTSASGANLLQVNSDALINGITVGRGLGAVSTNAALGVNALLSNTSGSNNAAVGTGALQVNTSGATNTAIGYAALNSNTASGGNTALGSQALVSSTGASNTAIGQNALVGNTTGSSNIGIGANAGSALTTGSNNTIIGSIAGTAGLADTVIIGAGTTERMRINSSGNVGIGTSSPGKRLDVAGDVVLPNNGILNFYDAGGVARNTVQFLSGEVRLGGAGAGVSTQTFYTSAAERMRIDASGNVGIGTTSPSVKLAVVGDQNLGSSTVAVDTTLSLFAGNSNTTILRRYTTTEIAEIRHVGAGAFQIVTNTGPILLSAGSAERMRIDASGNVGIGTTAPDALLSVNGAASFGDGSAAAPSIANFGNLNTGMFFPAADTIAFAGGGTERMRIDASGNMTQANATSGAGAIVGEQTFRLAANGTAFGAAIGDFFGATSAISLEASSVYEITIYAAMTKTTAGTATWTLTASSAPTRIIGTYQGSPITGIAAGTPINGFTGSQGATTAAFAATGSLTTAVNHAFQFTVQVQTNAATSFKLQLTQSAGTATPLAGSYYTVKKISATTGTFV
jgi:hypothetical protein